MSDTPQNASPPPATPGPERWSRRRVLGLARAGGLAGASYLLLQGVFKDQLYRIRPHAGASTSREVRTSQGAEPPTTSTTQAPDGGTELARWSDPATWGGQVPGAQNVAVIEKPVLLDVDADVDGVRITPDGELVFDPAQSRTLRSTSNVQVDGALRMRPSDPSHAHRLVFEGVDEGAFVGGHTHAPVPTDVGLWVMGQGLVDLAGTPKTAWTHAAGALESGARTVDVADATGWQVGDEIVVTPTEAPTVEGYADHHDRRTISSITGNTVTLDRPLEHPHPEVTVREGAVHRAEVLNLTRNVSVEGTEGGKAHIMILAQVPQNLYYTGLVHMGPQQGEAGVLGRYCLHFHMVGDASRGSMIEGLVAERGGNHAFVAHLSNGVTFRACIAHDTSEDPYWWDLKPEDQEAAVPSNDIVYDRCVAHHITPGGDPYGLAGFMVGAGSGNVARGCVATAILGSTESSPGYHWPSHSLDRNTWVFEDNVAHNNANSAIYFWQNNVPRTIVDRFTAYHCTQGILAGAYSNMVSYRDVDIYACTDAGLFVVALPAAETRSGETITYERVHIDQAGLSDYAIEITEHLVDSERETTMSECTFKGGNRAQVGLPTGGDLHQLYLFQDCTFEGNEFWLADDLRPDTHLRVQDAERGSLVVRRVDQEGDVRSEWNAAVSPA